MKKLIAVPLVLVCIGAAACGTTTGQNTPPAAALAQATPANSHADTDAVAQATQSKQGVAKPVRPPAKPHARPRPVLRAGFVVSSASAFVVQPQPAPGSCHASEYDFADANPDRHCTPGALNPAVTQAASHETICVPGWTKTVRPPTSITDKEKLASLVAYGDDPSARGDYEYDHLVSLELGGAVNDPRNLWPEYEASPNPKDAVENELHRAVCSGSMTLAKAQHIVVYGWQHYDVSTPLQSTPNTATTYTAPASGPAPSTTTTSTSNVVVHPGAFCSPAGASGVTTAGTPMTCGPASDGRDRWHHA